MIKSPSSSPFQSTFLSALLLVSVAVAGHGLGYPGLSPSSSPFQSTFLSALPVAFSVSARDDSLHYPTSDNVCLLNAQLAEAGFSAGYYLVTHLVRYISGNICNISIQLPKPLFSYGCIKKKKQNLPFIKVINIISIFLSYKN
jgi:hypothetical protein